MVVRVRGVLKPLLLSAEKTRSSDSFTAASGRPTRISFGSPLSPELTSTWTSSASIPWRAAEESAASMVQVAGVAAARAVIRARLRSMASIQGFVPSGAARY